MVRGLDNTTVEIDYSYFVPFADRAPLAAPARPSSLTWGLGRANRSGNQAMPSTTPAATEKAAQESAFEADMRRIRANKRAGEEVAFPGLGWLAAAPAVPVCRRVSGSAAAKEAEEEKKERAERAQAQFRVNGKFAKKAEFSTVPREDEDDDEDY